MSEIFTAATVEDGTALTRPTHHRTQLAKPQWFCILIQYLDSTCCEHCPGITRLNLHRNSIEVETTRRSPTDDEVTETQRN